MLRAVLRWIDFARIDVCICGGITEAKKSAGWCETHTIDLAIHNPWGPVSAAAGMHLNLSCPNFGVMELAASAPPGPFDAGCHQRAGRLEAGCLLPLD